MHFVDIVSPKRPARVRHGAMDVTASHGRRLARATRIETNGDEGNMISRRDRVSVGIVDNDCLALSALGRYVNAAIPGCSVVWMYETGRDALARCTEQGFPQVVLVDMSMTDMEGAAIIRRIRERTANAIVIAITSFPITVYARDAASSGAQAIVGKSDLSGLGSLLAEAAHGTLSGEFASVSFGTPQDAFARLARHPRDGLDLLSEREKEIIELCSSGLTSKEIGDRLHISATTVNTHLQRACDKVHAKNRIHLVSMYLRRR